MFGSVESGFRVINASSIAMTADIILKHSHCKNCIINATADILCLKISAVFCYNQFGQKAVPFMQRAINFVISRRTGDTAIISHFTVSIPALYPMKILRLS